MTAVLEPQAPGQSTRVEHYEELPLQPAPSVIGDPAAPFHCGAAMAAGPVPIASLGWAPLELGSAEWSCACGYRIVDGGTAGDPLEAVQLASARVESLQWELDAAQERFEHAVQSAARLGTGREDLGRAAGLTVEELQDILVARGQLR